MDEKTTQESMMLPLALHNIKHDNNLVLKVITNTHKMSHLFVKAVFQCTSSF